MANKYFKIILFDIVLSCTYIAGISNKTSIERPFNPIHELLPLTRPFIISGSVEKIIEFLKAFPRETSYIVLRQIVQEKESSLSQHDKAHLIFGLANAFREDTNITEKIFELLFLINDKPISQRLVDAAGKGYTKIITLFLIWAHTQKTKHPELENIEKKSLLKAIDTTDIEAFKNLIKSSITFNKNVATEIIWYVVSNNKNATFIELLADKKANLWSTKNGHTLATKSVELNNKKILKSLVQALKKQGATQEEIENYLNRFVDKEIGTPIQIALGKGFTKIELYLREQGTQE